MKQNFLMAMVVLSVLSGEAYAASPLSGTYKAVDSTGCANLQTFSWLPVTIEANKKGLELISEGQVPSFAFQVGHEANVYCQGSGFCYDDEQFSFDSSYSADQTAFTAVESVIEALADQKTATYVGQVDFKLNGSTLEIDSTADGQPAPVALSQCLLDKN